MCKVLNFNLKIQIFANNVFSHEIKVKQKALQEEMKNHKDRDKVLEIRFDDEIVKAGTKLLKGATLKFLS